MSKHIKRLSAPKSWHIKRKGLTYITKPNPGTHRLDMCISLNTLLKELLGLAKTTREVKKILSLNNVLVDGVRRRDVSFPVGLMDTIQIPEIQKYYRMSIDKKGKLTTIEIDKKEANIKPCKIINKSLVKGKVQLNFLDSRNILVEKDTYKTEDSLILKLPEQEIVEHLRMEKSAKIFMIEGKHRGEIGTVADVHGKRVKYISPDDETIETSAKYAIVIGKNKPAVKVI